MAKQSVIPILPPAQAAPAPSVPPPVRWPQNPLPLIIPCHRIVRKDDSLGGFSAPGGLDTKKRLLNLEGCELF